MTQSWGSLSVLWTAISRKGSPTLAYSRRPRQLRSGGAQRNDDLFRFANHPAARLRDDAGVGEAGHIVGRHQYSVPACGIRRANQDASGTAMNYRRCRIRAVL